MMKLTLLALLFLLPAFAFAAEPAAKRPPAKAQAKAPNPPDTDFSAYAAKVPWTLSEDFLAAAAARQKASNFYESKVAPYTLPELLTFADGRKVASADDWERVRRPELLALFRQHVYGVSPPRPANLAFRPIATDPQALGGRATLKRIAISFGIGAETFTFNLTLFVPNQRSGPAPVVLLLNHRGPENTDPTRKIQSEFWPVEYAVSRGYAMAAINVADEVDPDRRDATDGVRAFYRRLHPDAAAFTWATLGAWAWSGSRAVDYLETDAAIDAAKIAVIGHSRTGKTALWAAAQDTRFALACVNCAGEGGPALTRRDFGETLGMITRNFPYWFTPAYARYADSIPSLPIDQHELIALVAPRGYHGADATQDLHADPRGSWLALVEASKVWALLGRTSALRDAMPLVNDLLVAGPLAYHMRAGGHALTTFDWKLHLDHADTLFRK
jgi:dienelactone hydrolase